MTVDLALEVLEALTKLFQCSGGDEGLTAGALMGHWEESSREK